MSTQPEMLTRALERAHTWLNPPFDKSTTERVQQILDEGSDAVLDHFGTDLHFGTAGLRGIMDAGTSRMNEYTTARAALGLARALLTHYADEIPKGVIVGYDARLNAREFAIVTVEVLVSAGIPVMFFDRISHTPLVAFSVKNTGALAGIMITSSHNPPQYNGFKVYWSNGAQIISPVDEQISEKMQSIDKYAGITRVPLEEAIEQKKVKLLGRDYVDTYIDWAMQTGFSGSYSHSLSEITVVYTPLHGAGGFYAEEVLQRGNIKSFIAVEQQMQPDGEFPTVSAPNPEKEDSWELALNLAQKKNADLVLANDGDADRIGVAIPDKAGDYRLLTGNEIGTLLLHYLLMQKKEQQKLNGNEFAVSTAVSTPLTRKIIESFGGFFVETLTGFKWMGNAADDHEKNGKSFVLAFEEAFGITFGTSRDKDGIIAIALVCEIAAWCKSRQADIAGYLDSIAIEYGIHLEDAAEKNYEGATGPETMKNLLARMRSNMPGSIAGFKVVKVRDVLNNEIYQDSQKTGESTGLPPQDLLTFYLEDGSWVSVRPSGTEPKIKAYVGVAVETGKESIDTDRQKASEKLNHLKNEAMQMLSV